MTPVVSICVPTRNRSASLRRTLAALVGQTYRDVEIIVGDDASSDDTPEVVREFDDVRVRYLRHAVNLGIYQNWNSLVAQARGRYVSIYHDHDNYLPTIVERSVSLLDAHPDMAFVHTAIVLTDNEGAPVAVFADEYDEVSPGSVLQERFARSTRNTLCAATTMVRRDRYASVGAFDPSYGLPADRLMWIRLASQGSVGYVSEPQAFILGRSKGDPTERFSVHDLLGNYRISVDALGRHLGPGSADRWILEEAVRREVHRDLFAALLKAAAYGTPAEFRDRLALVHPLMSPLGRTAARLIASWPTHALVGRVASRVQARRLQVRHRQALEFCRRSPILRAHLPASLR